MTPFEFKGDWEFGYQFDAFKSPFKKNKDTVRVYIKDKLDEDPEPLKEQIEAINYITDNPEKIRIAILKAVEEFYPIIKDSLGYDENDEDDIIFFPKIESLEGYSKVFGVGNVFIHIPHKENVAYVGLECWCSWDDEHGMGILFHKDRLVAIDQADQAFNPWKAYLDNGTDEEFKKNQKNPLIPLKYKPHPKFNKLKPSQKAENDNFEYLLIAHSHNQKFKELTEKGEININGKNISKVNSFFEQACQSNNMELVRYMFERGVNLGEGIHRCINGSHLNKEVLEYLLDKGCDINKKDASGNTILHNQCQELARIFGSKQQIIKYGWGNERLEKNRKLLDLIKSFIYFLIESGGDPAIENTYGWNSYSCAKNLTEEYKLEIHDFINDCMDKAKQE